MSSAKSGAPPPSHEKARADTTDDKGAEEKNSVTIQTINDGKKGKSEEKTTPEYNAKDTPSSGPKNTGNGDYSAAIGTETGEKTHIKLTLKESTTATSVSTTTISNKKVMSTPSTALAPNAAVANGPTARGVSKHNATSHSKIDSSATQTKKEKIESLTAKPVVTMSAAAVTSKHSPQQHSQPKPHMQQQQQQQQHQQHRYFVPSRQNQEEAVFKMVQNIFKLLENRGPLTMAQLEYNLPILIFGSSPNTQTMNATTSSTGDNNRDGNNVGRKENIDKETSNKKTSLCEEKLIPGNMVPDIVELLVTLGLIQQQTNDDDTTQQQADSSRNQFESQPRFAVHFGKPKQFLVTPTNILSEISKAQTEIQLSRQRQELLKEALSMGDQQAAERVKHIVLQHPQVVDDPVYVTALRNLQVDGMLMAGAPGNTNTGSSNASSSTANKDGSGRSKAGVVVGAKKAGGGKRRQTANTPISGNGGGGGGSTVPGKRKRQRLKKEVHAVRTGDTENGGSGNEPTTSSGNTGTGGGSLPTGLSKSAVSSGASSATNIAASAALTPSLPSTSAVTADVSSSATTTGHPKKTT